MPWPDVAEGRIAGSEGGRVGMSAGIGTVGSVAGPREMGPNRDGGALPLLHVRPVRDDQSRIRHTRR